MQIKINKLDIKSTGFRWENPLLSWNWIRLQYTHLQSSCFILVDQENIRIVYSGCNANELRSPKLCLSASVVFAYALWNTHKISEMCMCYETRGKKYKNMAKIVMQNTWASIMHSNCAVFSMVFPLRMETVLLENAESPFICSRNIRLVSVPRCIIYVRAQHASSAVITCNKYKARLVFSNPTYLLPSHSPTEVCWRSQIYILKFYFVIIGWMSQSIIGCS